jgi:chromosome segregation ATPase
VPTVAEVEELRAEVESLKERAAKSKGALESLRKELPDCPTAKAAAARLKELEALREEVDAEFSDKLRQYRELCDAHDDPAA